MTHPIEIDGIVNWLRSKEAGLGNSGVQLVEIRKRQTDIPGVAAEFETAVALGRINAWVTGEFDFEAIRKEDGKDLLFRHEKVDALEDSRLESAYEEFFSKVRRPEDE